MRNSILLHLFTSCWFEVESNIVCAAAPSFSNSFFAKPELLCNYKFIKHTEIWHKKKATLVKIKLHPFACNIGICRMAGTTYPRTNTRLGDQSCGFTSMNHFGLGPVWSYIKFHNILLDYFKIKVNLTQETWKESSTFIQTTINNPIRNSAKQTYQQ